MSRFKIMMAKYLSAFVNVPDMIATAADMKEVGK